jgi:glycerol kinase
LAQAKIVAKDIAAQGITNQRDTKVMWNRRTGAPIHNAITWQTAAPIRSARSCAPRKAWSRRRVRPRCPTSATRGNKPFRNRPGARPD